MGEFSPPCGVFKEHSSLVVKITLRKAKECQELFHSQVPGQEAQPAFLTGGCWQVPRGGGLTQQVQSCASENPWAGTRIGVGMENKAVRGFHWCVWTFLGH